MSELNVKLLEIAKELLLMEYHDKKAQDHNRWLLESEKAWRVSRTKLEHPPFPPFPTHEQILERAKTLRGFVHSEESESKPKVEETKPSKQEDMTPTLITNNEQPSESCTPTTATLSETVKPDCVTETTATISASSNNEKLNDTIADDIKTKFDNGAISGMKQFNLPENLLAYSRIKVANNLEDRVPGSARIITNLLDSILGDNKKEK